MILSFQWQSLLSRKSWGKGLLCVHIFFGSARPILSRLRHRELQGANIIRNSEITLKKTQNPRKFSFCFFEHFKLCIIIFPRSVEIFSRNTVELGFYSISKLDFWLQNFPFFSPAAPKFNPYRNIVKFRYFVILFSGC